jgi:uncharacterized protein
MSRRGAAVQVKDEFWSRYQELVLDKAIPYQWGALNDRIPGIEPSRGIRNLRIAAGIEEGEFYGFVFQDSDLAKWLETASYGLEIRPGLAEAREAEEAIGLLAKAQAPDGYLDSYYLVKDPQGRWKDLEESHELYCAGHLIEAAVAYYEATGGEDLLAVARRFADLIDRTFGPEEGKLKGYDGHPEVELALVRLYEATGEERYLALARYFVDQRGAEPYYFELEGAKDPTERLFPEFARFGRKYFQAHERVRLQRDAEGHAVRLVYLYSAVADLAYHLKDEGLAAAAGRIWDSIEKRRMYVTGGIGSTRVGEAFTCDYDLPSDSVYAETCASVGMAMLARRMLRLEADRRYSDVLELELYNGALAGISLDGTKYFYVNPLEVRPEACASNPGLSHVKSVRQGWYACACCPSNLSRLILSVGRYVYGVRDEGVDVHLYVGGEARLETRSGRLRLTQTTRYPYEGRISLALGLDGPAELSLRLRIPGWCRRYTCTVNGEALSPTALERGYLAIRRTWSDGDTIELELDMPVEVLRSDPRVRDTAGKVAIKRGPLVYCLEETDNGPGLSALVLDADPAWTAEFRPDLLGGTVELRGRGRREAGWAGGALYAAGKPVETPVQIVAIPYAFWCNRGEGEMAVWIRMRDS